MSAKNVILTAIHFKGPKAVRAEAGELAASALCSRQYVLRLVRLVEAGLVVTTPR